MLQENDSRLKPPKIMQTLVQGFNLVAAHPYIMAFPFLLDLFFWFGPFYRMKELLSPWINEMMQTLSTSMTTSDVASVLDATKATWEQLLANFNLLTMLRTYPIGIPSLLSSKGYSPNPLGSPLLIEVGSSSEAATLIIACVFVGLLLSGLYYALIGGMVQKTEAKEKTHILYEIGQLFVLFFVVVLAIMLLTVPVMCFLSSFSVLIPTMGTIPLMILGLVALWIFIPFIFSAHGIFSKQLSALKSISLSTKFVRISSMATTVFLTLAVALSYGLDLLWSTPPADNWLFALGILGHAFISSGILAASFVYYRDGTNWMEEVIKLSQQNTTRTQLQ